MHDVDVRLVLIVHLIQNQLVYKNVKIHGVVHCKSQSKKQIMAIHLEKK